MKYLFWTGLIWALSLLPTYAEDHPTTNPSQLEFVENQGQWASHITYRAKLTVGELYVESNTLAFTLWDVEAMSHEHEANEEAHEHPEEIDLHGFKIHFDGANPQAVVSGNDLKPYHHNYFLGNDPSKWASDVPIFSQVQYDELYAGIDMRVYSGESAIKYDFYVDAGVDARQIRMRYEGLDDVYVKDGNIQMQTSVNHIQDLAPVAWQFINGKKQKVAIEFQLEDGVASFHFPDGYDTNYPLTIDPTLVFSSYTGATADNWGFTATYDTDGNLYGGGIVFSAGYPTVGAYQGGYGGGDRDGAISKFNAAGNNLVYSTYLGGTADDQPHSLIVSDNGELFVFGRTFSPNFPTSTNAYSNTYSGGGDIFVTRFNANGNNIIGSTYVGGTASDAVNGSLNAFTYTNTKVNYGDDARGEVMLDAQGNCYIAACTQSGDFPVTANAFQPAFGGGGQDGCILRLNPALSNLDWSSFLGGSGEDAAYSVQVDDQNNVYVAGGTAGGSFPTTAGTWRPNYQGGNADGFLCKINSTGSSLLASTFVGTGGYDQAYFVQLDEDFDVYAVGQTRGIWPIVNPPSGTVYSNTNAKQFIIKLDNNLSAPIYSTVFGSANASFPNISPTAFLVDRCENVYVSGWGGNVNNDGNTNNMPISADAFQNNTDGSDFYLIALEKDAQSLLYGSYFGSSQLGEHVDGGTSRFDKEGIVYQAVCAGCGSSDLFPTTPGAYSNQNGSANCNLGVFKIEFELSGIEADFTPLDDNNVPLQVEACPPLLAKFENSTSTGPSTTYFWDFDEGGNSSTAFEPTYTYTQPGTYNVMLIVTDPTTCNITDTTYRIIEILTPPVADAGPDQDICPGLGTFLDGSGGVTYNWTPSTGLNNVLVANPFASPTTTTDYILTVADADGCEDTDTVTVEVVPAFQLNLTPDTTICEGANIQLTAVGGSTYTWDNDPTLSATNISDPVASPSAQTTYYVMAEDANGCTAEDSVTVDIYRVYTISDTSICFGDSIRLSSFNGASFNWSPVAGLSNANIASPLASPTNDQTYTLTATNSAGCISTEDVFIEVFPLPLADAGPGDTICEGGNSQLIATGGISYQWSPSTGLSNPNIADPSVFLTSTTQYIVLVTDANGCQETDSTEIFVYSNPNISTTTPPDICFGDSAILTVTGANTYQWEPTQYVTDPTTDSTFAIPPFTTTYTVIGQDLNGCADTTTVRVGVVPLPETEIEGENQICAGGNLVLTASGGDYYVWSTGDTAESISFIPTGTQTYYATSYVGNCRGTTDSLTVDVFFDYPEASFEVEPDSGFAPFNAQFINTTTGAVNYEWDFGSPDPRTYTAQNPSYIFPYAGEWEVMLIASTEFGCADTTTGTVIVKNVALHIPSAFTPNGDSYNDVFSVGSFGMSDMTIRVYSRWGQLVYEGNGVTFEWDGTYKGEPVPEGVYTYILEAIGENNNPYGKAGTITIVR